MIFRSLSNKNKMYAMVILILNSVAFGQSYKIVDSGQITYYDSINEISAPSSGQAFYGQDAQFQGNQPSYTYNGDGTITDNVSGLMWSNSPDMDGDADIDVNDKLSYDEALAVLGTLNLAGYNDWRLPTIKELYSLILFSGLDPSGWNGTDTDLLKPFIDTTYFDFAYGDTEAGERIIDAQFATSTLYVGTTMGGEKTMFGVNFADGRIKGYPTGPMPGQTEDKGYFVLYVRGNPSYGINDFVDNGDGTITDNATGLMWTQSDNGEGLLWQDALAWIQQKNSEKYLGYNDWRLPDVKELQSIVDYTRSPSTTGSAAINPLFNCSTITDEGGGTNYPFYWSGTTHANMQNGGNAAYLAFGEGLGWMEMPPNSGNYNLLDVHGAGCQRSDPKTGDPADYPYGHGPQGDVIRLYNYIRLVRDASVTGINENQSYSPGIPDQFKLDQNFPNPFNPETVIRYQIPESGEVQIKVFNLMGQEVKTLVSGFKTVGEHIIVWDGIDDSGQKVSSGIYLYNLSVAGYVKTKKMALMR